MRKNWILSPLVFLVLIVIGLMGYFALVKKPQTIPQPINTQTNDQVTTTPTPVDETANWKEYKSDLGYTIKYPSDWKYEMSYPEIVCFGKEIKIIEQNVGRGPGRCGGDHVFVWAQSGVQTNLEDTVKLRQEANPNVELRRSTIDGSQAVTFYAQNMAETFFSSNNGVGYIITLAVVDDQNYSQWRNYYDSMLSTFKFTP